MDGTTGRRVALKLLHTSASPESVHRFHREAVRCVQARAWDVPEPSARERFLREVPANVQALALAHSRWGEDALTGK